MDSAYRVAPLRVGDPARLGDYRLVGRLGAGGMGTVYLAEREDGSHVAVKVIHTALGEDPVYAARFRGEVERARQVPPFCTARFLDADLEHTPPYLVVEYVDGPSLTEVVAERGPLPADSLHSLAVGVATALVGIHGAGVIHRDLKPGNVLLPLGSTKVIDFGLSRPFESPNQLTRTDVMVGTISYMAPERMSRAMRGRVNAAADIFSWGCVVAFAGTGRTPFEGDSPSATIGLILTQPPDLTGLPETMRELVLRALSKNPADRPTAPELLRLLTGTDLTGTAAIAAGAAAAGVTGRAPDRLNDPTVARPLVPAASALPAGADTEVVGRPIASHRPRSRRRLALAGAGLAVLAILLGACAVGYVLHVLHRDPAVGAPAGSATGSGVPSSPAPSRSLTSTASPSAVLRSGFGPSGKPARPRGAPGPAVVTTNVGKTGPIGGPGGAGFCVDVDTNTGTPGNKVQLFDCNGVTGQRWTLASDGTLQAFGKCLDIDGNSTQDRALVELWDCDGLGGQQWRQRSDGSFLNPQSGKCLDDPGGRAADQIQLQIWDCNALWPQDWHFFN